MPKLNGRTVNDLNLNLPLSLKPWEVGLLTQAADSISRQTTAEGFVDYSSGGTCDPWNMVEAAMGATVSGNYQTSRAIFGWLRDQQLEDGSFCAQYSNGLPSADHQSVHTFSYLAVGLWHYFLVTQDAKPMRDFFPMVEKAIERTLELQTEQGDISWSVSMRSPQKVADDALVSSCSSIALSLDCAYKITEKLNLSQSFQHWSLAKNNLLECIRYKPHRFDRSWPSKKNFSMDWFYPVLMGCLPQTQAKIRLAKYWQTFVIDGVGCLCTTDNDWVTVAETCELILALLRIGSVKTANKLWHCLRFHAHPLGSTAMGYVQNQKRFWPENEQPTWSSGVTLLAADALFKLTKGHDLFTTPLMDSEFP